MQLSSRLSALFVSLVTLTCCPVQGQDYDLAILNGLVMDPESGLDGVRNLGIKEGKIAVITNKAIKGKEKIAHQWGLIAREGCVVGFLWAAALRFKADPR